MFAKLTTIESPKYLEFATWSGLNQGGREVYRVHSHDDRPCLIYYYGSDVVEAEYWAWNDVIHRTKGPSFIKYYENGMIWKEEWWLGGFPYTKKDHKQAVEQVESMNDTEKLLDSRQWVREMVA